MGFFTNLLLGEPLKDNGRCIYNGLNHVYYQRETGLVSINEWVKHLTNINDHQVTSFYFSDIEFVKLRKFDSSWATVFLKTKNNGNFTMELSHHGPLWHDLESKFDINW